MKKADLWSGIVLLIFSAIVCWSSILMPYGSLSHPRAGFLPLWYGIILGVLSICLILKTTITRKETLMFRELFNETVQWQKVPLTLFFLLLYAISLEYVGFVISSSLVMIAFFRLMDPQPWKTVIKWALVASLGSYLIFVVCLKLRLPEGLLGVFLGM